jgi:peptidoglycan-associated lipoprotein
MANRIAMSGLLKNNCYCKMLNLNKIYLLLIIMIVFAGSAFSQKKEIELGHSEFNALQYYNAAKYFQKAILKITGETQEKQYATFMLAECYWMMNEPAEAEPYYKELAGSSFCDSVPLVYLRYANILRTKGDVAGARDNYKKYLQVDPGNQEAKTGLLSCEWILASMDKKAQINVEPLSKINSPEDDFAPAFLTPDHNQLIFTSNRMGDKLKAIDQWTGSAYSDLLETKSDGRTWGDPEPVEYLGLINSEIHEGTPALSGDYKTLYFTRCDKMAGKKSYCQIWNTKRLESRWASPMLVLADTTANVGQPSISKDELTLFFASDMKGTLGGKDIWMVKRESKDQPFGTPVNLGRVINTTGDEVFPYLYNDTTLLFSSNGYNGYGGWDIYMSTGRDVAWNAPVNLQAPFNSGYDDFGIIIIKPGEEGFFTSNRPGGKGGDDIYRFTRKNLLFTVAGKVADLATGQTLKDAKVLMTGDDGSSAETSTDRQGNYRFGNDQVLEDHVYELTYKKDNYFSKKESVNTHPFNDDHDFTVDMQLEPIPEKPIVLPDILYALDKWDLAPQYQDSLTNLVALLNDNGNIVIELRSHTDTRGSDQYNDVLSQKRAQSVVDFIISQGIDPRRLVAKGYGEKVPRVLDKDVVRENYRFKAGTELNDKFINSLPSEEIKEAAYQLNRRTEFSVLSKDFKP